MRGRGVSWTPFVDLCYRICIFFLHMNVGCEFGCGKKLLSVCAHNHLPFLKHPTYVVTSFHA